MKREHAASLKAFKQAINHCRVALATKQMFNLGDIERYLGVTLSGDKIAPLSIRDFNTLVIPQLEKLKDQPPNYEPKTDGAIDISTKTISVTETVKSIYDEHPLDTCNWIPPRNPKQIAQLYPAQIKASKDLAYKLCIENRRGVLLRASVGVGKTYMYGQLLRWLFDHPTFFQQCISPWPSLIITKASIVEQTRRVMVNEFGLDGHRQVTVMNYDALRSSKGLETMIDKTFQVQGGVRYEVFKWRPFLRPRVIIIDESQAAKNEGAQQSDIIYSLEEDQPMNPIKLIFSSATPFTRVSEAKYACITCGIPYKMI